MLVLKFGGTSVSTKERIHTICEVVQKEKSNQPIVVVSAIRGVTDLLLSSLDASKLERKRNLQKIKKIHFDLIKTLGFEDQDYVQEYVEFSISKLEKILNRKKSSNADEVVAYGEVLSSFIISQALCQKGISAEQVIATKLIVTDDTFTSAEFIPHLTTKNTKRALFPLLRKGIVPVVTGFIGATHDGRTTTLGRGGSDYSAAIIGYAMNAKEIQIWTDVDGIYTSDPRLVSSAIRLGEVTFNEASELAAFGAKVLHPRTIRPAIQKGISVRVLNTLNPESEGTLITSGNQQLRRVTAIASQKNVTLVNVYSTEMLHSRGFLVRIFEAFSRNNISVDLVSVSEVNVSITLESTENLDKVVKELSTFTTVTTKNVGVVSLIGERIVQVPHVMRNIFSVLDMVGVHPLMISQGASDINISLVIDTQQIPTAVQVLHDTVVLSNPQQEGSYV